MRKRYIVTIVLIVVIAAGVVSAVAWQSAKKHTPANPIKPTASTTNKQAAYQLKLLSGTKYSASHPDTLQIAIINDGKLFRSLDTSAENSLMLYIIRTDRSNFQSMQPKYDANAGTFSLPGFQAPTDGSYKIYAQFVPSDAPKSPEGLPRPITLSADIAVGEISNYVAQPAPVETLFSNVDGFETALFFASGDSPSSKQFTYFNANETSSVAISINRNGMPYKNLQLRNGSLGRIIAVSPNLQLETTTAAPMGSSDQSGLLLYTLTFHDAGINKLYMQTKSENHTSTFDYNITVKARPLTSTGGKQP
jgi:hypothetical protein